ncbi:Na-translocating system protein MpsC family protein [Tissierella praeacuta]|uniref:Na-translocating system protein MpsC family protein n=1 Tax=Tissierella praeacuta TaxID=43131 RepID=UPI0028AA951C|nr:Na-translocating system protein MpsC family protein [Tissierella praeacuta]
MNRDVLQHIKILYVEDDNLTRNWVCNSLKKKVGKIIMAENGNAGIRLCIKFMPDIIVTDLIMSDMNGIEMMRELRERGYRIPCIITSALSDAETILETVDLKIEKYLIKPIDIDILIRSLTQIATDILEKKEGLLVVNQTFILTDDAKNKLEIEIRNIYSKYLKEVAGKGAKYINIFINGKRIEIISKSTLTTLEESILATGQHYKSIEMFRKIVYENTMWKVEEEISRLIDRKIKTKKIEVCPKEEFERILLEII